MSRLLSAGLTLVLAFLVLETESAVSVQQNAYGLSAETSMSTSEFKAQVESEAAAMTFEHAMLVLHSSKNTSAQLLGFLQEKLGHLASHGQKTKKQQLLEPESPGADVQADYGSGLKNAMVRLNEMMLETIKNMDAEDLECREFSRNQNYYIEELEEDLQYYQRMNTEGNARQLDARGQKDSFQDKIPVVKGELIDHNAQCVAELADLNRQLIIARGDSQVMGKILELTKCSDETDNPGASLVQCVDKRTGRHYTKIQANDPKLKQELAKLKHPKNLDVIKNAIAATPNPVAFVQQGRNLRNGKVGQGPPGIPTVAGDGEFAYGVTVLNASADPNLEAGAEECSIAGSSFCPELRERFLNIAGGVSDSIEDLETMIENKQSRCEQIRTDLTAEFEHYDYWFKVWETRHAAATAELGESRTAFKNKVKELGNAKTLYEDKMAACHKNLDDAKSELCALHKIRGELATMSAWDKEITDCAVSDWEVPACPVTCGKGLQVLSRIVEMLPGAGDEVWSKGHECPVLYAQQSCNEFRCPVDCELEDWEEWSRCTVTCGGGVKERLRSIVQHPTPQGNPCELTLETILCNSGPCDEDCILSDWTEWSTTCSKVCGGGQQTRIKTLVDAEKGAGTCDKFYTPTRFQTKPCNTVACGYQSRVGVCTSKVDVMLLIDGSGSLGQEGWDTIKHTSLGLARAMGGDATLGALVFSSPYSFCGLAKCTGAPLPGDCDKSWITAVMTPADCGMDWISHLTSNLPSVIDGIEKATWPSRGTLTSKALKSAQVEMVNSRKDAPSTVILLTDGFPYSSLHTDFNAQALIESGARLMMIPIGSAVADAEIFEDWVSHPAHDNLVASSFEDLTKSNITVNTVLSDFCMTFVP